MKPNSGIIIGGCLIGVVLVLLIVSGLVLIRELIVAGELPDDRYMQTATTIYLTNIYVETAIANTQTATVQPIAPTESK